MSWSFVPAVHAARRSELEALDAALVQIAGSYAPITVRGAFYQAVSRGLVPKDETKGYRLVQRRLLKLRESGELPYGWMTDGSRTVYGHVRYRNADEFASSVKTRYRQDYWAEADEYVEIWIEKEALAGVVKPVVDEFGLDLYVTRGFASVTYLQEAADDISLEERPVYVYLFTDYDPAGTNIADQVEQELSERAGGDSMVHVERAAVTPEQIRVYGLPTRPTKQSRRKSLTYYEATHGSVSVELDAMPPDVLREEVRQRIERHMDPWRLEQMRMVEREEQEGLARLLSGGSA
jgi:hypothetical protein